MSSVIAIWMLVSLFLPPLQRPVEVNVRMRLFAASQPSEIRVFRNNAPTQRVRASGAVLLVDERRVTGPLRLARSDRVQAAGMPEVVALRHPAEVTARNGVLLVVSSIPREDYLAGVLAGEAAVFRSAESLKAMAVAARTYAAVHMGRHQSEGFDFCDTTHCQDFRGAAITPRIEQAVAATSSELLWRRGTLVETLYHQDCGGTTESQGPDQPPVYDSYCTSRGRRPWVAEITPGQLQSALQLARVDNVAISSRSPSGRAASIRIDGAPSRTFQAEAFRLAVGRALGWNHLRSDLYEVRRSGDRFVFEGYGAGHGIGLCQNGTAVMGELGRSYREILAFYYPGTTVGQTATVQAWIRSGGVAADLESTQAQDSALLEIIESQMRALEQTTRLRFDNRPLIRVFPTVAAYRDATGEPGWMAASTRGNTIRLQPSATLQAKGMLQTTLAHELAHVLIESKASRDLPLWFREGLVLWLTEPSGELVRAALDLGAIERSLTRPASEAELRQAYHDARSAVGRLVQQHGRDAVLAWLQKGLPGTL
jgi:stage II sporulation protein D